MSEVDVLIVAMSVVVAYLVLVVLSTAVLPVSQLTSYVGELLLRPFAFNANRADTRARHRRIEKEIDLELGRADPWGRQARSDIIQATLQAQRIRMLDEKFRRAIGTCVRTHWSVAEGLGATHMSEAARHPLSGHWRQRVIDLAELLGETIEEYPLVGDAPDLIRLHVGLHRIAPTCLGCVYWNTTVAEAPRLCPPAQAIGLGSRSSSNKTVVEAQVVEGD